MMRLKVILFTLLLSGSFYQLFAQTAGLNLKTFGYFQNSFQHLTAFENQPAQNSFSLQQLNLFLQKHLSPHWTAFVNLEFVNSYSSLRNWGALSLEEAWVSYRPNNQFTLKLGLQIPIFNNLNEIKNRTPLLPYIIRPLIYETSFGEIFPIEEFVPARAFVQANGFLLAGKTKFDYAVYLGNSPNINSDPQKGQTGIDTTTTFLVGGRLGIRYHELKLGLSATHEKRNEFIQFAPDFGLPPEKLQELPTTRLGGDLSYNLANFSFESEFIIDEVNTDFPELELSRGFYYATLGYHFTDKLFGYGSYWIADTHIKTLVQDVESVEEGNILVPTMGISYDLNDRIRLKGQFARIISNEKLLISKNLIQKTQDKFDVWAIAVSVFF